MDRNPVSSDRAEGGGLLMAVVDDWLEFRVSRQG